MTAVYDIDVVEAWIADDPDAGDRYELAELLAAAEGGSAQAVADLADRFSGVLEFGTAGLRGHLGAGPNRMNRAVVIRAAAGLARFLHQQVGKGFSVVIGYDARHRSYDFAVDTAAVVVAAGGRALLMPSAMPTPVTAFALRHLNMDAAVMVTASHNPPEDNGYKVYLGGRVVTDGGQGAQIVPPVDAQIFECIQAVESASAVERADSGWEPVPDSVLEAYRQRVVGLVPAADYSDLRIVVTSMHGVGGDTMSAVLREAGFTDVHVVTQQHEPDPDFPTVAFPNPEEDGALDFAYDLARRVGADLILANDPDADRCSAAVPCAGAKGGWLQLTGDQVGSLLGEQAAKLAAASAQDRAGANSATSTNATADASAHAATSRNSTTEPSGEVVPVLANSMVSSRMLGRIAQHYGLEHRATLTGFKWISRVENLLFGYEEALGYCVDPAAVRDKDGISACLRMAVLAAQLKASGKTLIDELHAMYARYGVHYTSPVTIRVEDLSIIAQGMANLRANGIESLAGSAVTSVVDLAAGWGNLPPTNGMMFLTEAGDRVIARPSGTEPKLKCYCEVILPVKGESVANVPAAWVNAAARMDLVKADVRAALGV